MSTPVSSSKHTAHCIRELHARWAYALFCILGGTLLDGPSRWVQWFLAVCLAGAALIAICVFCEYIMALIPCFVVLAFAVLNDRPQLGLPADAAVWLAATGALVTALFYVLGHVVFARKPAEITPEGFEAGEPRRRRTTA
jgi:hypothetical protein